jgi:hypothetical protein
MINVTQKSEREFIIEWDENDPGESIFNSFTEQDFIDVLMYYSKKELDKIENSSSTEEEHGEVNDNIEELTEHFFEDPYLQATNEETYGIYHQENNEAP